MPNRLKVAFKDAEQFAQRFWTSAVAKLPGRRSRGQGAAPQAESNGLDPYASTPVPEGFVERSSEANNGAYDNYQSGSQNTAPRATQARPRFDSSVTDPYSSQAAAPEQNEHLYNTEGEGASESPYAGTPVPADYHRPEQAAQPRQPAAVQPIADPQAAAFGQLRKQVEDDFYKLARTLPEISAQFWRERLVSAGNKTLQKPPDYAGAIRQLQEIQKELQDNRPLLDRAAFDERSEKFSKKFVEEMSLLGAKADPLSKAFLKTFDKVESGALDAAKALPVVVKIERDLQALIDKRVQALMAVAADYERIQPIVARAEAAEATPPANGGNASNGPLGLKLALTDFDKFLRRVPIARQFFPKGTPAYAPPPPPSPLTTVKDAVAKGFKDGFQGADLDEIKRRLAELEKLAVETLKNMNVDAQLQAMQRRLPVSADQLKLTDKTLGTGISATTYVVEGPNVAPMAAKVPKKQDQETLDSLDREAEIYARLGEHPNISKCYGKQQLPTGETALVMELVKGESAQQVFDGLAQRYNNGEVNREEYLGGMQHMIHGILTGLAQFEALGLAHRDIKGDNIRFDPKTGEPKILDMGLVQEVGPKPANERLPVKWTAPEGFQRGDVTAAWDSFGLGQTLYEQLERDVAGGKENPWRVSQTEGMGQGNIFVPGKGAMVGPSLSTQGFANSSAYALDEHGNARVMPLTKAADKKTGGELPGATAPAAQGGKFGVATSYVDFMNKLMHPDPQQRMPPSEALRHPFMTDRLMSKEEATKLFPSEKPAVEVQPRGAYGNQSGANRYETAVEQIPLTQYESGQVEVGEEAASAQNPANNEDEIAVQRG